MLRRLNCYATKVSVFLITAALIAGMVGCGPPSQDLEIRDWYDLDAVRNNLGGNHTLMNDLDSTTPGYAELASPTANEGKGWQPIGIWSASFTGSFDGQGYEIRDMFITRPDEHYVGLFSYVGVGGVVQNVGVVNADVTGYCNVGGLVGGNLGTVSNSYSTGSVTGYSSVGGLVGENSNTVSSSYSTGTVIGLWSVGGLVGRNQLTVRDSYSIDSVTGSYCVGGLVGENFMGSVLNSYSSGNVAGNSSVGGLVGANLEGTVSNSYSTGSVSGNNEDVGGLVGVNANGTVSNSYSSGNVTGEERVGGLVGDNSVVGLVGENNYGTVSNSYPTGSVSGNNEDVGGLVGANGGTVSNSYSTGSVTGRWWVGGLVGHNDGSVSNSHSTGSVNGDEDVGGLVGLNGGAVSNSYSTGSVTGERGVGGLVGCIGWNGGTVSNSYYSYDEVLINGKNIITIGALFNEDFDQWLANDKFLDVNERLSQEDGYYLISNVSDFKQLLAFGQDDSLKFRLENDLDLSTEANFYIPYFAGEFDGNGHKISNLSFSFDFVYNVGLFGCLVPGGKVTQVGVENVNITGAYRVGGLVGGNDGTVSNSYSSGNVTGDDYVGGLVGYNFYSTVTDSYSTGSVNGDEDVGGLVGGNEDGSVSNSYSTGSVTGGSDVGGLVGGNWGTWGTVSNSFWDIETSGQATSDGGTGKTTTEMKSITTFSGAAWDIYAVNHGSTNPAYTWNIVDGETYPFLSWQP